MFRFCPQKKLADFQETLQKKIYCKNYGQLVKKKNCPINVDIGICKLTLYRLLFYTNKSYFSKNTWQKNIFTAENKANFEKYNFFFNLQEMLYFYHASTHSTA